MRAMPDISYYGVDAKSHSEREEFFAWYEGQMGTTFNNRQMLEAYCQDDVTVLRKGCQMLRCNFIDRQHRGFLEGYNYTFGMQIGVP
jgi:hypothetical protein